MPDIMLKCVSCQQETTWCGCRFHCERCGWDFILAPDHSPLPTGDDVSLVFDTPTPSPPKEHILIPDPDNVDLTIAADAHANAVTSLAGDGAIPQRTRDAIISQLLTDGVTDPLVLGWMSQAMGDINQTMPKAREYGSAELRYLGEQLDATAAHPRVAKQGPVAAYEQAILFYMLGKIGRWVAANRRGEPVSDDTLLDLTTYAHMARLIRQTGRWT